MSSIPRPVRSETARLIGASAQVGDHGDPRPKAELVLDRTDEPDRQALIRIRGVLPKEISVLLHASYQDIEVEIVVDVRGTDTVGAPKERRLVHARCNGHIGERGRICCVVFEKSVIIITTDVEIDVAVVVLVERSNCPSEPRTARGLN